MQLPPQLDILPSYVFNEIPTFEEQVHAVALDSLEAIGELFLKHDVQHKYSAGLLHRHFLLQDGQIMLHCLSEEGGQISLAHDIDALDREAIGAHSFYLPTDGGFRPFEYCSGPTSHGLESEFLLDLRGLLTAKHLENVICLAPRPSLELRDQVMMETQSASMRASQSTVQQLDDNMVSDRTVVMTGWIFERDDDGHVHVRGSTACKKNNAGVHNEVPETAKCGHVR